MGAVTSDSPLDLGGDVWIRQDPALPAAARRLAATFGRRIGLTAERVSEAELAVTEVATNLVRHAVDGSLLLRISRDRESAALELVAVDSGPGIGDVAHARRDGVSSAGTLGIGLGAVGRLADHLDIHSLPGRGTVLAAWFWSRPGAGGAAAPRPAGDPIADGLTRPISGETICGDQWAVRDDPGAAPSYQGGPLLVMLCDGLGHGLLAARAAQDAVAAFHRSGRQDPQGVLADIHRAISGTRGGAAAVARIEPAEHRIQYCGVGNISGFLIGAESRDALLSAPGIVGHQLPRLRMFEQELPHGSALVMHSDGLVERWSPARIPGLLDHSPVVIAGQLLREAAVRHDDAGVVVAKGRW